MRLVAGSIVLSSILGSIAVPKLKWVAVAIGAGAGLACACADQHLRDGHARLSRLPYNRGATCDVRTIVAQLIGRAPAGRSELTAMIALTIALAVLSAFRWPPGGGGSILTVPLLAYVAGLEPTHAIAMSLLVVGVTSAIAAITHARAGRVQLARRGALRPGRHGRRLRRRLLARFIPGTVLLVSFAVIMIAAGVAMLRGRNDTPAPTAKPNPCRCSGSCCWASPSA